MIKDSKMSEEGKSNISKAMMGTNNPNYKDGNRISGNHPCPSCGRNRICEGRHSKRLCKECYENGRTKNFNKLLWYKKRRHELKKFAFDYLGGKCFKCGSKDLPLCCYQFHHRDIKEKEFTIGLLFGIKNEKHKEKIKKELDKCDLLCANCHYITHWEKEYTY